MMHLLATAHHYPWRPFIDPLDVAIPALQLYWFVLLVPIAVLVSIAYKAVRVRHMSEFPRAVAVMSVQIIVAMIALGIASFLLVQIVIPMIAPMPGPF
jgi:hypothetical protein